MSKPNVSQTANPRLDQTALVDEFEHRLATSHEGIRRLAYRIVGTDADDALQSAYVSAFKAYPRFRGEARFDTWLYRIVYNTCLNHLRSRHSHVSLDSARIATMAGSVDPATTAAVRVDLSIALDSLPTPQRAAVLLVDAEGLTFREAAEVLDLAEGTVASRVSRARKVLRTRLQEVEHG